MDKVASGKPLTMAHLVQRNMELEAELAEAKQQLQWEAEALESVKGKRDKLLNEITLLKSDAVKGLATKLVQKENDELKKKLARCTCTGIAL